MMISDVRVNVLPDFMFTESRVRILSHFDGGIHDIELVDVFHDV